MQKYKYKMGKISEWLSDRLINVEDLLSIWYVQLTIFGLWICLMGYMIDLGFKKFM